MHAGRKRSRWNEVALLLLAALVTVGGWYGVSAPASGTPGSRAGVSSASQSSKQSASPPSDSPSHPSAGKGGWRVAATLGLGAEDTAVSCPVADSCWALEAGELLSSDDGGATWEVRTDLVPAGIAALIDLDCPGANAECFLTAIEDGGAPVLLFLDLDTSTMEVRAVPGTAPLVTISCSTRDHCMATDGTAIHVTTDGGRTWTTTSPAQIVYSNAALDCVPTTSRCWLVGDNGETPIIERTTNDGRSWRIETAPPPPLSDGLYDVDCPTVKVCYVVGADMPDDAIVLGTKDAGQTWTTLDLPHQDYALRSVSCTTATTCWATGLPPSGLPSVYATTDGRHWTAQTFPATPTQQSPEVSCPVTGQCAAVAPGVTFATTDGGSHWQSAEVPAVTQPVQAISCVTTRVCVGVADDALGRPRSLRSTDGGMTWVDDPMSSTASRVWDVDCPTVATCYAVSAGLPGRPGATVSHAFTTVDGGASWHSVKVRGEVLTKLSCPDATTCLAGGFGQHTNATLAATTDGGTSWHAVTPPPGAFNLGGVSCTSTTACVLITSGSSGPASAWTTDDLGATYEQHALPAGPGYGDVGCAGTTCLVVGSNGGDGAAALSRDGGVTWQAQQIPTAVQGLGRVSCGSAAACAAAAFDYRAGGQPIVMGTTDTGAHWKAFPVPARKEMPIDLTCVRSSCLASDVSLSGNPLILAGPA